MIAFDYTYIVAITDASGNITDTFAYDTYGKLVARTGTSKVIFLYNGRDGVVTDDNGLYYMRARYYSPEMRRFVNADIVAGQISNAVTLNRFAYANGNPVSFVDPFGLSVDNKTKDVNQFLETAFTMDDFLAVLSEIDDGITFVKNGVKFKKQGDYLIILGNKDYLRTHGIAQRRIRIDNLKKYPKINELYDSRAIFNSKFLDGDSVPTVRINAPTLRIDTPRVQVDAPGLVVDFAQIAITTTYDVSKYDDPSDRHLVASYDVATGLTNTALSSAAAAGATALCTKLGGGIGTAASPGIGTAVGAVVGLIVGLALDIIFSLGRDTLIEDAVRNN